MNKSESDIAKIILNRFFTALLGTSLEIRSEDRWDSRWFFDIVIYKGVYPLAIIEIKNNISNKSIFLGAKNQVQLALSLTNARFGIITDGESYYLYDRNNRDLDFIILTFNDIIDHLINPEKINAVDSKREAVARIIIEAAHQHLYDNVKFMDFIKSESFLKRITFDENSNTYIFSDSDRHIRAYEHKFFNMMFGEFKETQICRYTSLKTVFEMLNNLSFRMNGLVGMNDKSEVNYVESYLNKGAGAVSVERPLIKEHYNTIIALNKRYITSCSTIERKDNLTLWRLYADDARGVCLVFDIVRSNLNKHVILQKVKYADENGRHKELDFLRQIKEQVEQITGFDFEFRELGYWKHFFKGYDYSIEEEVRLLIIDYESFEKLKTDWVMTYSHSIINPTIDFRINSKSFPIKLRSIILGPKCPEQDINQVQLEEMVRRKKAEIKEKNIDSNLDKLKVECSKINHYR